MKRDLKSRLKDWGKVLLLLADEAAAVVIILLIMWAFNITLQLWLAVVLVILLGVVIFVMHRAVMPTFRKKQVTGVEAMVGLTGTVAQALEPKGVVQLEGEYWRARAAEGSIEEGETVEVLVVEGLTIVVRKVTAVEEKNP
ncbi:NfeD family protein [Chloroflexota bacterium]